MPNAQFDVILRGTDKGMFDIAILFNAPGDIEDYQYFSDEPTPLDLARLNSRPNLTEYGLELGHMLFGEGGVKYLDRALGLARRMPVYMRLMISDNASPEYQSVRWEAMLHPRSGARITTNENIRFCRYLSNPDGTSPSPLSLKNQLSALVVVANPAGIEGYSDGLSGLSPADVGAEIDRARKALGEDMSVQVLSEANERATAGSIVETLRLKRVDVLYLVCHGALDDRDGPILYLENERGHVDPVSGTDMANAIRDLGPRVPTLAVLVSCQSAGPEGQAQTVAPEPDSPEATAKSAASLTAFGPALSRAGVALVLAMQGNITMETAAKFIPQFFQELKKDGVAAHAMAVARSRITTESDWCVPVLYTRLKRGSAWYVPRFGEKKETLFRNVHTRLAERNFTPLVGTGIAAEDDILPRRDTIASDWAERRQVPILDYARTDLASVAQYVAVESGDDTGAVTRDELSQYLRSYLASVHGADFPKLDWRSGSVNDHILTVGRHRRETSAGQDCYSRIARLELPIFVTSSWNTLLEDALSNAGKSPITQHFEWYRSIPTPTSASEAFEERTPLVYHLFGVLDNPRSLVLTEDDYFAWLRAWIRQGAVGSSSTFDSSASIPHYVAAALTGKSLMFLGYRFQDWEFRMVLEGMKGFGAPPYGRHVGVQLEPSGMRIEPEAAQEYLTDYLDSRVSGVSLDIYWGRSTEFLVELEETAVHL